ncbi:MAG: adenine deaminase [Ruminiclostridium sp.]|nr:adenine deaminase [Ruminiclostridium sp.]
MEKSMIKVARGLEPADLVLKNGKVLNVFTEEFLVGDVAIVGDTIVGVGEYSGEREIDCSGKCIVPGFVDSHVHIESSMVTPLEYAKYVVQRGTTSIVADPHEIVNVCGARGMDYILDASENIPLNVMVMVPSSVPATDMETNGAGKFLAEDIRPYLDHPRVRGLGEMMRFVDVLNEHEETMEKIQAFSDGIIDGHAPGITGKDVQAYRVAGILNDHECATAEEGLERLRAGFYVLIREGSGAKNLEALVKGFLEAGVSLERCLFCSDDRHLEAIETEGHMDLCVRKAIQLGVPAAKAYKMASYNAAQFYDIPRAGAVGAGHVADLVVLDDVETAKVSMVIKSGKLVDEEMLSGYAHGLKDESLLHTVILPEVTVEKIQCARKERNHVLEMVPNQLLTLHREEEVPGTHGTFVPNGEYGKLVVAERHGKNGRIGVCPVKGYGIANGAVATTVSHDSHNIIAAGDNDRDIVCAINHLREIQGGYVIVSEGKVVGALPLPLAGLISLEDVNQVQKQTAHMVETARSMGVPEGIDPFTTLSFMALTVIPEIRLTERGVFDVTRMEFV